MDYLSILELYHHGIKGQKWGVRRFENEDGSLTPEGEERYGVSNKDYQTVKKSRDNSIEKYDTGPDASNNRNKEVDKTLKSMSSEIERVNNSELFKKNHLALNSKLVDDGYGGKNYTPELIDTKTGKTIDKDPEGYELYDYRDIASYVVNYTDTTAVNNKWNPKDSKVIDDIDNLDWEDSKVSSLNNDAHYGRDNWDSSDVNLPPETIVKANNALKDLSNMRIAELNESKSSETKYKMTGKDKAVTALSILGAIGIIALTAYLDSKGK